MDFWEFNNLVATASDAVEELKDAIRRMLPEACDENKLDALVVALMAELIDYQNDDIDSVDVGRLRYEYESM